MKGLDRGNFVDWLTNFFHYAKWKKQVYILKVAKFSPSLQVASKIKGIPRKRKNLFLSLIDYLPYFCKIPVLI